MTFNARYSGSFTSAATLGRHDVVLPQGEPDYFRLRDRTDWGDNSAIVSVESSYFRGMAWDTAQGLDQANGDSALTAAQITANGFRFIDTANPPTFAALATSGTDITTAEPAVVTMSSTGSIAVGDIVRITDSTGMLQIAGYDFQVDAVSVDTNITLQLDSSAFAAVATAGNVRLIIPGRMYPRRRFIVPLEDAVGITQAVQPTVCFSVDHDFTTGERVTFIVPPNYGMTEINQLTGTVLSIGNMT